MKPNYNLFNILITFTKRMGDRFLKIQVMIAETFGLGTGVTLSVILFTVLVLIVSVCWFLHSAPPNKIIITSGNDGSGFRRYADRYAKILARNGVKLEILKSEGSLDNLRRLVDPSFHVDVGFVQSGVSKGFKIDGLVSLGSVSYEPLYIFYRSKKSVDLLSQFSGKRIAIGREGTGTKVLALDLLKRNGIKIGDSTEILLIGDEEACQSLREGKIDVAFMMGDSASREAIRDLMRMPEIRLYDFTQADAYVHRIGYLNKIVLLKGSIDFGDNIPERDVNLISPTVELIARENLHPALSDLLIEAAAEVHGRQGAYQRRGEFPALLDHEYPISDDAQRFYKTGKKFFYKHLPFWLASLSNRILVVIIPMILIVIPGFRIIPLIYHWRMRVNILKWYRALLTLEGALSADITSEQMKELLLRLDQIEKTAKAKKVPAAYADEFYALRGHIGFVRERFINKEPKQQNWAVFE